MHQWFKCRDGLDHHTVYTGYKSAKDHGSWNQEGYRETTEERLASQLREWIHNNDCIFMHYAAPCHNDIIVRNHLNALVTNALKCLGNITDEDGWAKNYALMKWNWFRDSLRFGLERPSLWEGHRLQNMPRRAVVVITAKGGYTGWYYDIYTYRKSLYLRTEGAFINPEDTDIRQL